MGANQPRWAQKILLAVALGAALGGVAGCHSLPSIPTPATVATTAGPSASAAVRLQGARGPLSAAQSKQVLDSLHSRRQDTDIFDRHLAVEEAITTGPLTTGNAVRLLQDGPETYAAMLKAIYEAHDHINLETYILDDDDVGRQFSEALLNKQQQGVQVHLIHDSVGTFSTPPEFFQRLREAGVQVLEFNPINPLRAWKEGKDWSPNRRDHRKLLIVDGHTAFLGGINISSVYSGGSRVRPRGAPQSSAASGSTPTWRDTHLQLQGPVVAELQKLFIDNWLRQTGKPPLPRNYFPPPQTMGRLVVRAIGSAPAEDDGSPIYTTLLSAIASAETTVYITNAYFAPDPQLLATLKEAAARGVDVQLILPGQSDSWLLFHAARGTYDDLLQSGVKIHERRRAVLHSKTALIDGVWSTVGSTNLDWRSFLHNQEVNAVVLGAEFGDQMQRMFDTDRAASDQVLLPTWRDRSVLSRIEEWFARLWAYWL